MNPTDDLAALADRYRRLDALLADPWLHTRVPSRSGWSAAEHLWHTEVVATGVLGGLARLLGGRGERQTTDPAAVALLEGGVFPPGRKAPERVHPPADGVDAGALAARLARNGVAFARLDPDALSAAPGTLPHPVLGPLTAVQWVRFARIHAAHHDGLAAGVTAAAGSAGPDRG